MDFGTALDNGTTKEQAIEIAHYLYDKYEGEYHFIVWYRESDTRYLVDSGGWSHYGDSYIKLYSTRDKA